MFLISSQILLFLLRGFVIVMQDLRRVDQIAHIKLKQKIQKTKS